MVGGDSSEGSEDKTSDTDYHISDERSDGSADEEDDVSYGNKGKGKMVTTRSKTDEPAMISISESIKMRGRNSKNSGIITREPREPSSSVLAVSSSKRKRDFVRIPIKNVKKLVDGSTLADVVVSEAMDPVEISSPSVNAGIITTTTASSSSSHPTAFPQDFQVEMEAITRSSSLRTNPSSSNLQDFISGSSSGSNNTRPSRSSVEAQANITRSSTSSQSFLLPAIMDTDQQQQHFPSSSMMSFVQSYGSPPEMASRGTKFENPSSNIQGNITRPLSVNLYRPDPVSRPIETSTYSDLLRSIQPQATYEPPHHTSSSSSVGLPQHHPTNVSAVGFRPNAPRQQPLLLQDVTVLDLNLPANSEDDGEEEKKGLNLNLPARDE